MKKILSLCVFMILIYLNINAQLVAGFSTDVTQGCDELTIQFTDESTPIGEIVTWEWDLGDGSISNAQNFSHQYTAIGEYTVCLTVTNSLSETDTHCENNYISVYETPIADAGPDVVIDCISPSVTLDGSASSSGPNITYEWIAPTGASISNDLLTNVNSPGTYTLVVSNAGVCTSMDMVEVVEDVSAPIVTITQESFCSFPYVLSAIGSSTGPQFVYEWQDENGTVLGNTMELVVTNFGKLYFNNY